MSKPNFFLVSRTKKIFVRDAAETILDDEKEAELTKTNKKINKKSCENFFLDKIRKKLFFDPRNGGKYVGHYDRKESCKSDIVFLNKLASMAFLPSFSHSFQVNSQIHPVPLSFFPLFLSNQTHKTLSFFLSLSSCVP